MFDYEPTYYGTYRTRTFADIFPTAKSLENAANGSNLPIIGPNFTVEDIRITHTLLYARYGNSSVASSDENRFIFQLLSDIWQFGPVWAKKQEIRDDLLAMDAEKILEGDTNIYNHSFNPSVAPTTQTLDELATIDSQNDTKHKRGKLEGYAALTSLLNENIIEEYVNKFKHLFITYVGPSKPLYYETEV